MKTLLLTVFLIAGHEQGWYQVRATPLQFQAGYGNQFDRERAAALTRRSHEIMSQEDWFEYSTRLFGYQ